MPIYEYQCHHCGHQLEELQASTDKPLIECPKCHEPALNKLVSAAGFQLKGTGWYMTDYSKKGKLKQGNEGASSDHAKPSGTDSAAKETKSADKPAEKSSSIDSKTG